MSNFWQSAEHSKPPGADLFTFALFHAQHHMRVHPLHHILADGSCSCPAGLACPPTSRGKHPRFAGYQKYATTNPARIRAWWDRWPESNIGGIIPPFRCVLDCDPRNGGDLTYERLQAKYGEIPPTLRIFTPGRRDGPPGTHDVFSLPSAYYFLLPACVSLGPGLELLSYPHNVVLAGSVGANGRSYEFEFSSDYEDIAQCPDWLLALLPTVPRPSAHAPHTHSRLHTPPRKSFFLPPIIPEGQRNATLHAYDWALWRRGTAEETRKELMYAANAERCNPPLPPSEIDTLAQKVTQQTARLSRTDPRPCDPHTNEILDRLTVEALQRRWPGRGAKRALLLAVYGLAREIGRLEDIDADLRTLGCRACLDTSGSHLIRISRLVHELCQEGLLVCRETGRVLFDPRERKWRRGSSLYSIPIHSIPSPSPQGPDSQAPKAGKGQYVSRSTTSAYSLWLAGPLSLSKNYHVIYAALCERSWGSQAALARALSLSPSVVSHALKLLEKHELAQQTAGGDARCCGHCGRSLEGKRKQATTCSARCRKAAQRAHARRKKGVTLSARRLPTKGAASRVWVAGPRSLDEVAAALGVSNALALQDARHEWERQQFDATLARWWQSKKGGPLPGVPTPEKQADAPPAQMEETPLRQAASYKKAGRKK